MTDARFEEGAENPVSLIAQDADDLGVMSALVQDSVFVITDMTYSRNRREFGILLNRFRWEDRDAAEKSKRSYERVRSVLMLRDVMAVRSQGIARDQSDTVLSLLSIGFTPGEDGTGKVLLTLAGDGAVECDVEALDATLRDVTRPYLAPSHKVPDHGHN